jgi:hypothetical protein
MTKNPIMHSSCQTYNPVSKYKKIKIKKKNIKKLKKTFLYFSFFLFLQSIYDKQIKLKYSNDFFIIIIESIGIFSF